MPLVQNDCDLDAMPQMPSRSVAGTVLYMAPEKLLGLHADEVLCDVYALGATAYEAAPQSRWVEKRLTPRGGPPALPGWQ